MIIIYNSLFLFESQNRQLRERLRVGCVKPLLFLLGIHPCVHICSISRRVIKIKTRIKIIQGCYVIIVLMTDDHVGVMSNGLSVCAQHVSFMRESFSQHISNVLQHPVQPNVLIVIFQTKISIIGCDPSIVGVQLQQGIHPMRNMPPRSAGRRQSASSFKMSLFFFSISFFPLFFTRLHSSS